MAPASIAHYRITGQLGQGGMGTVYRAIDTRLNREVAIKVLPDLFADDPDRLARFTREAQVLASLNHPGIAAIYGVEERALVMELVEGDPLPCPAPRAHALDYARQIAEALEYAHERGIVHRDLKPANMKITPEGRVKLLDFGLAKITETAASPAAHPASNPADSPTLTLRATQVGVIMGTAAYMAPEQARGQTVDRRADIWAFGVVLFEMLSGKPLFEGDTVSDTLAGVLKGELDLRGLPPQVSPAIRKLLLRCLERDRKQRLQSIGDARLELEEAIAQPEPPALIVAPPAKRPLIWMAATALLLASVAVLAFMHFREPRPRMPPMRYSLAMPEGAITEALALSPDARYLAFTATNAAGRNQLWLQSTGSSQARVLAASGPSPTIIWSQDSASLIFDSGGALTRFDIATSAAQVLCPLGILIGGSWGANGTIVYGDYMDLRSITPAGGAPKIINRPRPDKGEVVSHWPQILPDGKHVLHTLYSIKPADSGIYVMPIDAGPDSGPGTMLLSDSINTQYVPAADGSDSGFLVFARGATISAQRFNPRTLKLEGEAAPIAQDIVRSPIALHVEFSAAGPDLLAYRRATLGSRLVWVDRSGATTSVIGEMGLHWTPRISRDGSKIIAGKEQPQSMTWDLWQTGIASMLSSRLTFNQADFPIWSPDGKLIAFTGRTPSETGMIPQFFHNILVKPSGGAGNEETLLRTPEAKRLNDWSPDSRYLVFEQLDGQARHLWALPISKDAGAAEGPPKRLFTGEAAEVEAAISRDGKWIAYAGNATGANEIYIRPFAPGSAAPPPGMWQISRSGGTEPRWRGDGRELFYLSPAGDLTSVEIKSGSGIEAGQPQRLFHANIFDPNGRYDVAADGQHFLLPVPYDEQSKEPTIVLINWANGLRGSTDRDPKP